MKAVEQQLLSAMRDTPPETDCTLSAALLVLLELKSSEQQFEWLCARRPAVAGKQWQLVGGYWDFAVPLVEPAYRIPTASPFPPAAPRNLGPARVIVKPLVPFPPTSSPGGLAPVRPVRTGLSAG